MVNDTEFKIHFEKNDLSELGYDKLWIYFVSAYNATESMRMYRHLIIDCLKRRKENFDKCLTGEYSISKNESFPPGDYIEIDGIKTSLSFMIKCYTYDFFQMANNCLDYIAHIIDGMESMNIKEYKIDFDKVSSKSSCIHRKEIRDFITDVHSDEKYVYLRDFNNNVKHNNDISIPIYMQVDDMSFIGEINAFSKKVNDNTTHEYKNVHLNNHLKSIHKFVNDAYGKVIGFILSEKDDKSKTSSVD